MKNTNQNDRAKRFIFDWRPAGSVEIQFTSTKTPLCVMCLGQGSALVAEVVGMLNEHAALVAVAEAAERWIVDKQGSLENAVEWLNLHGDIACGGQGVLINALANLAAARGK